MITTRQTYFQRSLRVQVQLFLWTGTLKFLVPMFFFCVSRVFARSFRNKKLSTHGSVLSCPHLKRFIYAAAPCVNTRRAVELTGALPPAPLPTSVINTFVIRLTRQFHEDCCCSAADQLAYLNMRLIFLISITFLKLIYVGYMIFPWKLLIINTPFLIIR